MLSMASAHAETYYTDLAREDYYLEGGEPPGRWLGTGAEKLVLPGTVDKQTFLHLYRGFSPDGAEALVRNAGRSKPDGGLAHHPGWDLTFSAPKSVSVLWSQAESDVRRIIQEAHHAALKAALAYLEESATFTKRGKAGAYLERPLGLVLATFEHGTSRAQDPQLHTHCIVFNLAPREDGSWGTVVGRPLFRMKMAAGALYRAELCHRLSQELGLRFKKKGRFFEVDGVPETLTEHFSTRRKQILAAMKDLGLKGAKAAAKLNLTTRKVKEHIARALLFDDWRRIGQEHGFSPPKMKALLRPHVKPPKEDVAGALEEALAGAVWQRVYFTERDFVRRLAEVAPAKALSGSRAVTVARETLEGSPNIIPLGAIEGDRYFAPRESLEAARALLLELKLSRKSRKRPSKRSVATAITKYERQANLLLTAEEKHAVLYLTRGDDPRRCVMGLSDEEKARVLSATRLAFERRGLTVITVSPITAGAAVLERETRGRRLPPINWRRGLIQSLLRPNEGENRSIKSLLRALRTKTTVQSYVAAQKRADKKSFRTKRAFLRHMERMRRPWITLSRKTVVVVDSAERASFAELTELAKACRTAGSTLIFLGNPLALHRSGKVAGISASTEQAPETEKPQEKAAKPRPTLRVRHGRPEATAEAADSIPRHGTRRRTREAQ